MSTGSSNLVAPDLGVLRGHHPDVRLGAEPPPVVAPHDVVLDDRPGRRRGFHGRVLVVNTERVVVEYPIVDDGKGHVLARAVDVTPHPLVVVVNVGLSDGVRAVDPGLDSTGKTVLVLAVEAVATMVDLGVEDDEAVSGRTDALGVGVMNSHPLDAPVVAGFHRLPTPGGAGAAAVLSGVGDADVQKPDLVASEDYVGAPTDDAYSWSSSSPTRMDPPCPVEDVAVLEFQTPVRH